MQNENKTFIQHEVNKRTKQLAAAAAAAMSSVYKNF